MNGKSEGNFFRPPTPPSGGDNNLPSQNNYGPGQEMGPLQKVVYQSRQTRQATTVIIKTRAELKAYLNNNSLDLITSAVEFQRAGSFIDSSYIVYSNFDGKKEPLSSFLTRYPQFVGACNNIEKDTKTLQGKMMVGG